MSKISYSFKNPYTKEIKVGDKTISLEFGRFSEQADAAVLVRCGETVVHVTVAKGRETELDYFPLSVEFAEKLYAGGKIKGSRWVKRPGRPSDDAILSARVIDRTLRPLFAQGLKNEVQVIATVLSVDNENNPDMLGLLGAAVAVEISSIPFTGPVAGFRMGYDAQTKQFKFNPTYQELEASSLDLVLCGNADGIVMVEAGADEISEDVMLEAFDLGQSELAKVCQVITQIKQDIGKEKFEFIPEPEQTELQETLLKQYSQKIKEMVELEAKLQPTGLDQLVGEVLSSNEDLEEKDVKHAFYNLMKKEARRMILEDGVRPDGRKLDQIREITCEVDLLPRTHGSAMFKRGATQALTVTTLGSPALGQLIENMEGEETRHYIHHYNMPPYASGEAGRFGFPKRREIGHGALAERALLPMIPSQSEFAYTIHVVSEIMSSNGSTSQASVCGSTLSLMAAGVPIKKPVAGIAMGLMSDGQDKFVVLSDIQGLEDHVGDMDFKVAGSADGITAMQMDIKIKRIPMAVMKQALTQARVSRMFILNKMVECISEPRKQLSSLAPKVIQLRIPGDKIGEVIGPGGKIIKSIIADTGADINIDEDPETGEGVVNIASSDQEEINQARVMIENLVRVLEVGEEFDGRVTRVENYGCFVELIPGKEGLVHVSTMSTEFISDPRSLVKVGDIVHVRIIGIDDVGKIKLSMLTSAEEAAMPQRGSRSGNRGGRSNNRSFGGRNSHDRGINRNFDRNNRGGDRRGGGRNFSNRGGDQPKGDGFTQKQY